MLRMLVALALHLALPVHAAAQSTHDSQVWTLLLATVRPTDDWRVHLEFQPRFRDNLQSLDQSLARWAVGRQITPRVSIWAGHAWVANRRASGTVHEQRIWQQLSATLPAAGQWTPSLRFRLEQRFVDQWADSSHRVRALARVVRPIDDEQRWAVALWNEVFVTLDDTAPGPADGLDRNRVFGGVRRRLSPSASVEGGYLWQAAKPRGGAQQHAHAAFLWLDLVF